MLKKEIKYMDYDGNERAEVFYFNLNKAELMNMELGEKGGMAEMLTRIVATQDVPAISKIFQDLILKSYGEKSPDGKRFIKSEALSKEFSETEAYVNLYMELATDANKAAEFINGIIPKDITEAAKKSDAKLLS